VDFSLVLRRPIETTPLTGEVGPGTKISSKSTNRDLATEVLRELLEQQLGSFADCRVNRSWEAICYLNLIRTRCRDSFSQRGGK